MDSTKQALRERIIRKNKQISEAVAQASSPLPRIKEADFLHYFADAFFGKAELTNELYSAWVKQISGSPQVAVDIVDNVTGEVVATVPPLQNTASLAPIDTRESRTRAVGISKVLREGISGVTPQWQTQQLIEQYNKSLPETKQYAKDASSGWVALMQHYGIAAKAAESTASHHDQDIVDFDE